MAKIAIVRVRGLFGIKPPIRYTLASLRLHRLNHCVVFEESPSLKGMLQVAKDYVCWGEVNEKTLAHLTAKRGDLLAKTREKESTAQNVKSDAKITKGKAGDAKPKAEGKKKVSGMLFALHAPQGGWNGTIKMRYPHGAAGPRKDMNELLVSMS